MRRPSAGEVRRTCERALAWLTTLPEDRGRVPLVVRRNIALHELRRLLRSR